MVVAPLMISESRLLNIISRSPIGSIHRSGSIGLFRIILVYHGVQANHAACLEPNIFDQHMKYIKHVHAVRPLNNLFCDEQHKTMSSDFRLTIAITFDDAFKNFYQYVLPLLIELDLPATLYAPVNFLGRCNEWDKGKSIDLLPIMTSQELREISSAGIEVGSHGLNHKRLSLLSNSEMMKEVYDSKVMLEDMLGTPIKSFSYPHGGRRDYNKYTVEAVKKAGYETAVTTRFGRFNCLKERFELKRIIISPTDTLEVLKAKLLGRYDWLEIKERLVHQWRYVSKDKQSCFKMHNA